MPLPPLAEQRHIVARIEDLAAKIAQARGLRQSARDERDALLSAHLGRLLGDPYAGVAGDCRIGEWKRPNEGVDDVADGPHVTPTYAEAGVPLITVQSITSGRIRFGDHKLRIAGREVEAWLPADREGIAEFLAVGIAKVPREPERDADPKRTLVNLARLSAFVAEAWNPEHARGRAPSLERALRRLATFLVA